MSNRKRYFLTGFAIVTALVAIVIFARFGRGTFGTSGLHNVKVKGQIGAPIHLVVYSDFQCPACKGAIEPLEELYKEFSRRMQFEFRHFPLERPHKWAMTAATFAECAAKQGKFWEFHDRLYQDQATWSVLDDAVPYFARAALELKLDREQLEQCLIDPKTLGEVERERSIGVKQEVHSTPTFFINGHVLVGSVQLRAEGKNIVLEELKKVGLKK